MRGAVNRSVVCFNNEFGDADTVPGDNGQDANDGDSTEKDENVKEPQKRVKLDELEAR